MFALKQSHRHRSQRCNGFTLIEMAIVLLILSLLAGGLTMGLSSHLARRAEAATDEALGEARDALLGYIIRKGYLPCPAIGPNDGAEDRINTTTCRQYTGLLPWATLGINGVDGWSRRLRYAVSAGYVKPLAGAAPVSFPAGSIEVRTRNNDGTELTLTTDDGKSVALVLSHGANGLGATDSQGSLLAAPVAGSDEARNAAANSQAFVSRSASDNPGAPGGAFDDRLIWLSPNLVAHRLASAGRLP